MNVDGHPKYLHSIKTTAATATTGGAAASFKVERRRRLISREVSNLSNSFVEGGGGEYHAQEPAAVPFVWESSPGTPKRHIVMRSTNCDYEVDYLLPPLTPPPSFQYNNKNASTRTRTGFSSNKKKKQNDASNVNLIQSMFPRLSIKRDHPPRLSSSSSTKSSSRPSSSSSSSSPSSQSCSAVSTPSPIHRHKLSFEYSSAQVEEEEMVVSSSRSTVSTLCFSRRLSCCNARFRGLYSNWF